MFNAKNIKNSKCTNIQSSQAYSIQPTEKPQRKGKRGMTKLPFMFVGYTRQHLREGKGLFYLENLRSQLCLLGLGGPK